MPRQSDGRGENVVSLRKYRGTVDDTGQQVSITVPRRSRRKKGWREHVSLLDVDVISRLEMTGSEMRVLFALMRHVAEKGGTESRCTIAEVADEIGMKAPNVSRIMKDLRDRHVVRTIRLGYHEITPWLAYSGDFDSWNAETNLWPEPIWVRGVNPETGEVK